MKMKLTALLLLFVGGAQAADVIPEAYRGDSVPDNEYSSCVDVYMNSGENVDGWRIEHKKMYGYEWQSELIKGTGKSISQGGFEGKFRNFYLDETDPIDIKIFTPTSTGFMLESGVGKNRNKQKYIRCTVGDYKTAMRRIAGVIIGKPLTKKDIDFSREQANYTYNHYRKNPLYGLDPGSISMSGKDESTNGQTNIKPESGTRPVVTKDGNKTTIHLGNAVKNVFDKIF